MPTLFGSVQPAFLESDRSTLSDPVWPAFVDTKWIALKISHGASIESAIFDANDAAVRERALWSPINFALGLSRKLTVESAVIGPYRTTDSGAYIQTIVGADSQTIPAAIELPYICTVIDAHR
jgi:hypothetical protein